VRWYASLRRSGEIAAVRRRGRRAGATTLSVYALEARSLPTRVAVAVSKSVGGAVERNRVKRRIKGALDALAMPSAPVRLVVIARPAAASEPYAVLARDVAGSLARLKVLA